MRTYRFALLMALLAAPGLARGDDWPQFRGPQRDNISKETGLLRTWPETGPQVLWSTDVAEGYGGAAIHSGRVYFEDYSREKKEWQLRCVGLEDGRELWRATEAKEIRPNHGITRAAPATDGGVVIALDPKCVLHGYDAENGKELWSKSLVKDYGAKIPPWYNGQCPLLDGERVILGVGGEPLLIALDVKTGNEVWRTPNEAQWPLSHSSVMPATIDGVKQYLWCTLFGPLGVRAEDGKLLWHHDRKFNTAVAPSPLALPGERVLMTSGYDAGTVLFEIRRDGEAFTTKAILDWTADEWNAEVHTPILWQDHLFAVGKKKRGLFTCLDLQLKPAWSSEDKAFFGLGSFLLADGMFFVLEGDSGVLRLLEANTTAYKEIASAPVLSGHDVWAPMALSDGRLVLRDMKKMICLDLRGGAKARRPSEPRAPASVAAAPANVPAHTFRFVTSSDPESRPSAATTQPALRLTKLRTLDLAGERGLATELRGLCFHRDRLYAVGDSKVLVLDPNGALLASWATARPAFSVAVDPDGTIFVGEEGQVELFTETGAPRAAWHDPDHLALVTAIGFHDHEVLCADVGGRCIRRFDRDGKHLGDIGRDARGRGFMLPNRGLDFAVDAEGVIHAANPGQHRVQRFSPAGQKLSQWGRFDERNPAGFTGCCNPTNIALPANGLTAVTTKAPPGLKLYNAAGELQVTTGADDFDPDSRNMDIAVDGGRIYVADSVRRQVVVYQVETPHE